LAKPVARANPLQHRWPGTQSVLQTLRAAIDWSYDVLDVGEQQLFAWLAVFVGGCTLVAAETIGTAASDGAIATLDRVATLVSHN
jgi:predicted ATPase